MVCVHLIYFNILLSLLNPLPSHQPPTQPSMIRLRKPWYCTCRVWTLHMHIHCHILIHSYTHIYPLSLSLYLSLSIELSISLFLSFFLSFFLSLYIPFSFSLKLLPYIVFHITNAGNKQAHTEYALMNSSHIYSTIGFMDCPGFILYKD